MVTLVKVAVRRLGSRRMVVASVKGLVWVQVLVTRRWREGVLLVQVLVTRGWVERVLLVLLRLVIMVLVRRPWQLGQLREGREAGGGGVLAVNVSSCSSLVIVAGKRELQVKCHN